MFWAWVLLAPSLLLFVLVDAYPTLDAFRLSTFATQAFSPERFAGIENYVRLLHDPLFWQSLRNTMVWTIVVVPSVAVLGLVVAIALENQWLRGRSLWRTIYFAPMMTSMVAAGLTWRWLFDPGSGVVNFLLRQLGVSDPPAWLASPHWALLAIMIVAVWQQVGYAMILFLAGLQTIPRQLYEAAEIDGAGYWSSLRHITLPLLNPTILLVTVILVINAFRVFTIPYVMTSGSLTYMTAGGPLNSTRMLVYNIYDVAFHQYDLGYGAANAVVLLILTMVVSVVQMRVIQRNVQY